MPFALFIAGRPHGNSREESEMRDLLVHEMQRGGVSMAEQTNARIAELPLLVTVDGMPVRLREIPEEEFVEEPV
jgi:hypothetical protein